MSAQTVQFQLTPSQAACNQGLKNDTSLDDRVIAAIKTVYDPEIPVNVHDLGLIYGISIDNQGRVDIRMTLTSPACPVAGSLPCQVERIVGEVSGVNDARVELVWDPPWTQARMSDAAQLELGIF
jgi:FeS assembly SUF system protein